MAGIWTEGGTCPCEPLTSCCVEGQCYDGYTEQDCDVEGGVFANHPCVSDWCHESCLVFFFFNLRFCLLFWRSLF